MRRKFNEWLGEDAKGPKKWVMVISLFPMLLAMLSATAIHIFRTYVINEIEVTASYTPLFLLEWAGFVIACLSFLAHVVTFILLAEEYNNFVFVGSQTVFE